MKGSSLAIIALLACTAIVGAKQQQKQDQICAELLETFMKSNYQSQAGNSALHYMRKLDCDLTGIPKINVPRPLGSFDSEKCPALLKEYLKRYTIWAKNIFKFESLHWHEARVSLLMAAGCDFGDLPLIDPIPEFVQPTPKQQNCVNLVYSYLISYQYWDNRFKFEYDYKNAAPKFITLKKNGCNTDHLPQLSPVPEFQATPSLGLFPPQSRPAAN